MEADWEIEIGGAAPVIDAAWDGLVDLRSAPERVGELAEVVGFPALGPVLLRLNADASLFFTVKCDVWALDGFDPGGIDPGLIDLVEFDAPREAAICGKACYVDLAPRDVSGSAAVLWADVDAAVAWCKNRCAVLRASGLRCCRVDLVIRGAVLAGGREARGVTAYVAACGATVEAADAQLARALDVFAESVQA